MKGLPLLFAYSNVVLTEKRLKRLSTIGLFLQTIASGIYCGFKVKKYLLAMPILELARTLRELNHLPSELMLYYDIPSPYLPPHDLPSLPLL